MANEDLPPLAVIEKELQERDYYEFFKAAWIILEPVTPLQDNWHIKYLCDTLQSEVERIARGEKKTQDIVINIPPRSLKSSIVTITLNAWAWIRFPNLRFIATSYGSDLAIELATKTRRIIDSEWYQKNWGHKYKLTIDQNTKGMFENTKSGFRKSVGVGGGVTGSGADILLIDDPLNPEEAHSQAAIKTCLRWFKETLYSRLNNQEVGLRIVVMQRLHESDITGWILKEQKDLWKHICLPVNDSFKISPESLKDFYSSGLFFPSRFNEDIIKKARSMLGSYGFSGQMGQHPTPEGGGIIKREWWKYYKMPPAKFQRKYWSWDTANKTGEENDYSVGQLWGVTKDGYYLLKLVRARLEYPDLKRTTVQHYNAEPTVGVLVEDKSSGQSVIQDLRRDTILPIISIEPIKDKVTRAHMASPVVESGRCYLPEDAPWLADFIDELSIFPLGAHDDQVDCATQFINYISSRPILTSDSFRTGQKMETSGI